MATITIYYKIQNGVLSLRNDNYTGYTAYNCQNNSGADRPKSPWRGNNNITTITIDNNIVLPKSCYELFYDMTNLTTINNILRLNTSNVINMSYMFNNCKLLTSLDLSNFNTSNVTSMSNMFNGCETLTSLDLSSFNTSNVTSMSSMFYSCISLTSLDLSSFDTSNVTYMNDMFSHCNSLISLNLSNFDTSNVIRMNSMFYDCRNLTLLDLSSFDTSKVKYMDYMFSNCRSLISLNLSNFDTSNVVNMKNMFYNCYLLTSLDVSNFDTSNVTDMGNIFYNCNKLTSLDLSSFNTSKVTRMNHMFNNCSSLTSLDLSNFDTFNVVDMNDMFYYCISLTSLDLSSFDISNVVDMNNMFYYCYSLITIYTSQNFKITNVINSSNMFYRCTSLVGGKNTAYNSSYIDKTYAHIDEGASNPGYFTYKCLCAEFDSETGYLRIFSSTTEYTNDQTIGTKTYYTDIDQITGNTHPKWYSIRDNITKIIIENLFIPKTGYYLFSSTLLEEIEDIEYLNTSNITNMNFMFYNCQSLTLLDLSSFDTSNVINMCSMFDSCKLLTPLNLFGFDTSNVTNMSNMFNGCQALTSLDVSNFNTSNVTNMNGMFGNCTLLTSLDLSSFDTSKVADISYMFYNCSSLTCNDILIHINSRQTAISIPLMDIDTFYGTVNTLYIDGTNPYLDQIAATCNNNNVYVCRNTEFTTDLSRMICNKNNTPDDLSDDTYEEDEEGSLAFIKVNILNGIYQPNLNKFKLSNIDLIDNLSSTACNWYGSYDTSTKQFSNPINFNTDAIVGNIIYGVSTNEILGDEAKTLTIQIEDPFNQIFSLTDTISPRFYTIDFLAEGKEISFGYKAQADDLYEELTRQPSDWNTKWYDYYKKNENNEYVEIDDVSAPSFPSGTYYKKIHDSLFKCSMDASFKDKSNVVRMLFDFVYPVGSYYETSESTFDPNDTWGGTWGLESTGIVRRWHRIV